MIRFMAANAHFGHSPARATLEENIQAGEEAVSRFKRTYGSPHSDTYIQTRAKNIDKQLQRHPTLKPRLERVIEKYRKEVGETRQQITDEFVALSKELSQQGLQGEVKPYFDRIAEVVKTNRAGNCQEYASLVQADLLAHGQLAHSVNMSWEDPQAPEGESDHVFAVTGLEPDAAFKNPDTWGDRAVVVDAMLGLSMPAQKALKYMKKLFKVDPGKKLWIDEARYYGFHRLGPINDSTLESFRPTPAEPN